VFHSQFPVVCAHQEGGVGGGGGEVAVFLQINFYPPLSKIDKYFTL